MPDTLHVRLSLLKSRCKLAEIEIAESKQSFPSKQRDSLLLKILDREIANRKREAD